MTFDEIIPIDLLLGKHKDPLYEDLHAGNKKKKKVDKEAMQSAIMRIPRMDVRVARDLIDIGIKEIYELQGRSAESLMEEIKDLRPDTLTTAWPTCKWVSTLLKMILLNQANYILVFGENS